MSTATAIRQAPVSEKLMIGDLAQLTPAERTEHYNGVCESVGVNPLTRPFEYMKDRSGKLTLYATKNCSEQLRSNNGVSIEKLEKDTVDELYVVTAYARDKRGRTDSDMGAVSLARLRGEELANAMMKAVTKAKRRVTLSICGLGWPDESEIDTITGARRVTINTQGEIVDEEIVYDPNETPASGKNGGPSAEDRLNEAAGHRKAPEQDTQAPVVSEDTPTPESPQEEQPQGKARKSTATRVQEHMGAAEQNHPVANPEVPVVAGEVWQGTDETKDPMKDLCPKCHCPRGKMHVKPCIGGAVSTGKHVAEKDRARAKWFATWNDLLLPDDDDYNRKVLSEIMSIRFKKANPKHTGVTVSTRSNVPNEWFDSAADDLPAYVQSLRDSNLEPGQEFLFDD